MADKYSWGRIHKTEEFYETQIISDVIENVLEYFEVEEIEMLTEDQIEQVRSFREELNEYSVMQIGYSDLINIWESAQ
jgi:uncharacterized protein YjaG (DUF416 family)